MGARVYSDAAATRREQDESTAADAESRLNLIRGPSGGLFIVHGEEHAPDPRPQHPHRLAERSDGARRERDDKELSQVICQRIRARTSDRIRDLEVLPEDGRIVIRGRCATFYTKQLAQHAVMGVIEDEVVVNEIAVGVPG